MGDIVYLYMQDDNSFVGKFVVDRAIGINKTVSGYVESYVLSLKHISHVDAS